MSENDDPVFEILCLKSSVHIPVCLEEFLDKEDECFREFPEFNHIEVEELFKNHQDITSLSAILQKLNFSFPFRPDLIPTVMSLTVDADPNFRYRSRFILYTFIAWQNNPIMEHAPVVIHSLTEILNLPDYSKCALDAIERCFQISFVKSPLDDFDIIFPLFKGFFTKKSFISMVMQKQRLLYQYLRALQISSEEKGQKDTPEIQRYMEFLKKFSEEEKTFFTDDTIYQIFNMISKYLSQLDKTTLQIFSTLSQLTNDSIMIPFVMLFATPIKTMMENEPPFLMLKEQDSTEVDLSTSLTNRKTIELPTFSLGIEGQFQYVPIETFKSGLDIQTALIIADKPHFKSYFKPENYERISLISTAYQKHELPANLLFEWFCETLNEMAQHSNSSYFFDFLLLFMAFYRNWRFPNFAKKFWETIFNTELFDDRFNAVNEKPMPPLIDKIRATVISILSKVDGFSSIPYVFESITTRPALMSEMLHRILPLFDKINTDNLNNVNLIRIISSLLIYYQNINFDKNYESINSFIESSRSSLFLFISRILQIKTCGAFWMNNKVFCITFLKFIFEPPIRPFVLSNTLNYLLSSDFSKPPQDSSEYSIFSVIHEFCTFTFDRIPQEQYVIISTEILQIINECLTRKVTTETKSKFIDLVEPLSSAINMLNNEYPTICGDFLVQAIHFLAAKSSEINLSNSLMILLKEATKKIFDKEPSTAIFSKFVQLIAGTQLSSISPSFIIKEPIALFPLVEVFRESNQILNILQFIYNLIEYSYYNSIIANEYNFDSFLLSIIQSHKSDLEFDQKVIQSLFQIVSLICNTTSSSPVIQKFIDLMCPINGKYLSIFQPLYIQKMQEIISSTMKAPLAFLPLNGKESTYIELKNVTSSLLGNKFTFTFWLSVDKIASDSKLNIFSILDCRSRGFYVMISTTSLLIKVIHKDLESTARCETPLPMGVWTPILIRVEFHSGKIIISPSIDRCICRKLEFNYDKFYDEQLQVKIGYTPDQKRDNVSHVYLSSFQIYNKIYPNDEVPRFFDIGPRQTFNDFKDSLFTLQLSNNKGDIGIEKSNLPINSENAIKAHLIGKSVRCHPSFCSVLISGDKADLFIPLFSFFDMPTIEGKYLLQVPDLTIDLIMTTLSISENVEKAFENKSGFQIISHLLLETKIFKPSYSNYNRLFMLLPTLTNENLKISLIKYVLVNFSLLSKFDRINQERIIKHWSRVLVYENQNLLAKVWNVKELLCAIEQFLENKLQQKENLYDIQPNLFKLLTMIASIQLTKEDLNTLIYFALKCSDEQSIYILKLFNELVRSESKTIGIIKENINEIYQLHNIIRKYNSELSLSLIDFIYELHNQNIITEINIQQHMDILIQFIQSPNICDDFLFGLIKRINQGKFELLPITCFIAMNMEDDYISTLFSDIKPHNLTFIPRFWAITCASIAPPDIRTKIIKFILECQKNAELNDIFYAVEIVSHSLGDDHLPHELILNLAQDLVHRLLKCTDDKNPLELTEIDRLNTQIDLLFQFASSTIFFQHQNLRILEEEFYHSPFFVKQQQTKVDEKHFQKPKPRHFSSILDDSVDISNDDSDFSDFSGDLNEFNPTENKYKAKEKNLRNTLKSSSVASQLHKMNMTKSNLAGTRLTSMLYLDNPYPSAEASDSEINPYKPKKRQIKKMSSQTIKYKRFSSDSESVINLGDLKRLKYKPSWIFEEISKYKKDKMFSIRTDKSGRWLDCDIAEWCMKLFDKRRGNLFLNFALLLISFMLKYHPNIMEIETHLKKMQLKSSQIKAHDSFLCLIKRNCRRFKRRIRDVPFLQDENEDALTDEKKMEEKKNDYKAFCCFAQFVDLSKNQITESNIVKMQKAFLKSQETTNSFNKRNDLLNDKKLETFYSTEMMKYIEKVKNSNVLFSELWNNSWRSLTFELAPWESAVVSTTRAVYERSLNLNYSLIPIKMKRKIQNELINKSIQNDFINNSLIKELDCKLISPKKKVNAKLLVNSETKIITLKSDIRIKSFNADEIRFIVPINRIGKSSNIFELILFNGKSYLIDILAQKLQPILKEILDISINNENSKLFTSQFKPKLDIITDKWIDKKISTFEYITKLNIFAGRTFNDLNHYPIFPWVLKTYCSKVEYSDLFNQNIYRDFSDMINPERSPSQASKMRARAKSSVSQKTSFSSLKMWNSEAQESDSGLSLSSDIESSLGSDKSKHVSRNQSDSNNELSNNDTVANHPATSQRSKSSMNPNQPSITHYILQPQSQLPNKPIPLPSNAPGNKSVQIPSSFIDKTKQNQVKLPSFSQPIQNYIEYVSTLLCRAPYNVNSFSIGPRFKFKSISDFFDENGFYHETIPELFSFPEFLIETDFYPAVELPLWANSPIDFVYKHRKLLESDIISSKIHNWFDCIFGVERADANQNTSSIVSSTSYSNTEEEDDREDEYSSPWPMPRQLFNTKHLKRKVPALLSSQSLLSDYNLDDEETNNYFINVPIKQTSVSMKLSPTKDTSQRQQQNNNDNNSNSNNTAFISSSNSYHTFKNIRATNILLKVRAPVAFKYNIKDGELVFATIDTSQILSKSLLTLAMINSNGIIKRIEIDFTDDSKKSLNNDTKISTKIVNLPDYKIDKARIPSKRDIMNSFVTLNEGFAVTNGQDSLLLIYEKNGTQKTIRQPFGNIKGLCSSGDYFATIGTDMTTRIFKSDQADQPIHSISTYQGETTCAAISKNFGIFVSGSIDSAIHIGSLSNGNVQKVVNIVNKPINIIISKGWGFIVVFSKVMPSTSNASFFSARSSSMIDSQSSLNLNLESNSSSNIDLNSTSNVDLLSNSKSNSSMNSSLKLSASQQKQNQQQFRVPKRAGSGVGNYELLLYTVNGIFVNSTSISDEITAWETWVDRKGFDYLAIALRNGKVHLFELYYMKLGHSILTSDSEIIRIKYDKHTDSLIMINPSGDIFINPVKCQK